ncbi:MAG: Peptidase family M28 [Candidatus Bathyarchaeota archaeon BA1]|nr:MAG: Peptidase family M28 [Candidatus Bathyarchaeota archaeon BA1]
MELHERPMERYLGWKGTSLYMVREWLFMKAEFRKGVKEELSGENAKSYVQQIARLHRIQASTMFHEAAEYVRDTLLKIGLKDANIEQFPSDGSIKYWTHVSPMGWEVKSAELRLVEPEERLIARYEDTPTCLHTHSVSTPPEGITAELMDVGAGLKPKEYEGKDVKGKFVLATGRARMVHEQAVYKRGAAGVITDTLTYEMKNVRESVDIPDAHAYQAIWPTKEDQEKVTFGFSLSKRQGNHLRALLRGDKPVRLRAKVEARLFPSNLDVVTATIPGLSKPEEEVFLIAHLCHPRPSANDNASGSGLLLEIARTIRTLIDSGRIAGSARTIRFIWVPETFGTIAFLYHHEDLPSRMVAGVNLDMVGENQELCRSTLTLDRTPDSLPSYLNDLILSLLEQSIQEFDATTGFGPASTFRYRVNVHTGGSDHHEFVDSTIGVPCIMLLQWPDLFYHSSMDNIDKVCPDILKRVGWVAAVAVLTIANADVEDAVVLASETSSRGIARIKEAGREAVKELFQKKEDPKLREKPEELAKALAKTAVSYKNKIEHIVWREREAVASVKRLASSAELENIVAKFQEDISHCGEGELAGIEEMLSFVAKASGVAVPIELEETEAEKEAKRIVPRRLFKAPLSMEAVRKALTEEEYKWYEDMREKDAAFKMKVAELLNFMDGKRTLHEIIRAVSAEYTETNAEHILKFLQDLEKMKLVSM